MRLRPQVGEAVDEMSLTRPLPGDGPTREQVATTTTRSVDEDRATHAPSGRSRSIAALIRLIQLGPLLVLVLFWLVMSFVPPYFLTTLNISNLALATAIPAVLALGQFLVILTGAEKEAAR